MLSQQTPEQLKAFYRLTRSSDWPRISELLNEELAATLDMVIGSTEMVVVSRLQGRAKLLKELLSLADDVGTILEKNNIPHL